MTKLEKACLKRKMIDRRRKLKTGGISWTLRNDTLERSSNIDSIHMGVETKSTLQIYRNPMLYIINRGCNLILKILVVLGMV